MRCQASECVVLPPKRESSAVPCFAAILFSVLSCTAAFSDFAGKVVSIADGNTITVLRGREQVKVRLDGIDAPQKSQPFGSKARQFTADACFGEVVTVVEKDTDRYGRTIAVIEADGENLNLQIVEEGFAWWYRKYAPKNTPIVAAEKAAREAQRGLWKEPKPVPPWEWRAGEREPAAEMPADPSDLTHWINNSSDKRPNKICRYFGKGDGRPCTADEGEACKVCGC